MVSGSVAPRVVALGGGHGLAATLSSLRALTHEITAIVTVADNGGSSGRLREEFDIYPPGDLRMALAALCGDDEWGRSWAEIIQYRFTSDGPLNNHALGNLLLAALWDRDGDPVRGLEKVGDLLKVIGRVLPMAAEPLDIEATFDTDNGERIVRGQVQVATTHGELRSLRIIPESPAAIPQALSAITDADFITLGPGSWYSSVLPHVLVPQQREAIARSKAKTILLVNLDASGHPTFVDKGEFAGYSPEEHVEIFHRFAPDIRMDYIVADRSVVGEGRRDALSTLAREYGGELLVADLRSASSPIHHDRQKLTSLFAHIFNKTLV